MNRTVKKGNFKGIIEIPASKSDSQRAILAAGLSQQKTIIRNVGKSKDDQAMLSTIQELGAVVNQVSNKDIEVFGIQKFPKYATIYAGESGLGLRLITSVCVAFGGKFVITGTGTLEKRSQVFFENHLTQMGVKVVSDKGKIPLLVEGKLQGGIVEIDGSASSQYLSGLLMGLPLIEEETKLIVHNLKSIPYTKMTLNTLSKFGIEIKRKGFSHFTIPPSQKYQCQEYVVEGDWSSASCWLVASALGQKVEVAGLKTNSLQADVAILEAFKNANCEIIQEENILTINGLNRKAFTFDATHCPDLFPALAIFASLTDGKSTIIGAHRLFNKESNRALSIQSELKKVGVQVDLIGDEMHIFGKKSVESATVYSHNDHRIAMAFGVLGMFTENGISIENAEVVAKSYPNFWNDLEKSK